MNRYLYTNTATTLYNISYYHQLAYKYHNIDTIEPFIKLQYKVQVPTNLSSI